MSARMSLLEAHPEELEALRAAGYHVDTDEELIAAFSDHYGFSKASTKLCLSGGCAEVTPGPDGLIVDYAAV